MRVAKIRIGGRMFVLDPETDVDSLRRKIVDAAASGADFVHFETAGGISVSALVTPHLPVRISEYDTAAEQSTAPDQAGPIAEEPPFAVGAEFDG